MIEISLCMIVKNAPDTIARCLDSVRDLVEEMVIVDTGSTDNTKQTIRHYTDKIVDFDWIDDFAAARNFAFSHAAKDYILWLDADDILLDQDRAKLRLLKETLAPSVDSVTMHYNLAFDETGNVTTSLRRNRLVRRQNHFRWHGVVHEYLEVVGNIFHSDIAVTHANLRHDPDRNIKIYEKRNARGEEFSPRDLFYYANELCDHGKYRRAIQYYVKFLATNRGWVEDNISACARLADCFCELGDVEQARRYIVKSFRYDAPRADLCCRMGYIYLHQGDPQKALAWYKIAAQLEMPKSFMGMLNHACWTWLPHLQLCVCYSQLGEYRLAYTHNELAAQFVPDHPSVLHNRRFLTPLVQNHTAEVDANFSPARVQESCESPTS
ncbi:MAG: glycosyltransferase [Thermaerobacter sp.]|nr:glycosyltransferase [Thermaerobacter sp.]